MGKRCRWTPEGLAKRQASARETALRHQPWCHSTGPRTPEGKARSRANAIKDGYRVELIEVVTDPDVAERQLVYAFLLWDQVPTELRALTVYSWCRRLVELGEGDRLAGFPALMVGDGAP